MRLSAQKLQASLLRLRVFASDQSSKLGCPNEIAGSTISDLTNVKTSRTLVV